MQEHNDKKNLIEHGFTLIELLVVIAILGILAAVVVFSVNGITDRGKTSACQTDVSTIQTALEAFDAKNGGYPQGANLTGLGVLAVAPDKFLNSAVTATNPSQVAGYSYTGSGTAFSVTVDGQAKTVVPSGSYTGGTC